jgi:hypothetical protein
VAWRDNRDGVFAVGRSDGADGFGVAYLSRDLGVGAGFSEGDGQHPVPDLLLERGADEIEREVELAALAREVFAQLLFRFSGSSRVRSESLGESSTLEQQTQAKERHTHLEM